MAKRIAIIVNLFPNYSETFIVEKILGLVENGFDVTVFATGRCDESLFEGRLSKIRVVCFPSITFRWLFSPCELLRCVKTCLRRYGTGLKAFRRVALYLPFVGREFDVIHFEFGAIAENLIDLTYFKKAKFGVSFRGYDLHFIEDKEKYSEVFRRCDGFHFISEYLLNEAKRLGFSREYSIVYPAINVDFYRPTRRKIPERVRIISVGRIHWRKGYPYALSAVKRLVDDGYDVKYSIVGGFSEKKDMDMRGMLLYTIHNLGLENYVELCGVLDRNPVKEKLSESDIFLHSAVAEGFGNALLEAQAMELPIVAFDAGGVREAVVDEKTGLLAPSRDDEKLYCKLKFLVDNKEERISMGKEGRKRVSKNFNSKKQKAEFRDFYDRLLCPPKCLTRFLSV